MVKNAVQGNHKVNIHYLFFPRQRVIYDLFQVEDQVRIPAQEQRVHWLRFSPIEEHFYRQQHQLCRADALKRFDTFGGSMSTKLSCVDRRTINALLQPLLRLRQACIHPQMVCWPANGLII